MENIFRRIVKDATLTLITEAIILFSFFAFFRLVAAYYGAEIVGIYSLLRRILGLLLPFMMLGLSEALGHYMPVAETIGEKGKFAFCALFLILIPVAFSLFLLNLESEFSSRWLLGNESYKSYIFPFSVLVVGLVLHTFAYSCMRGNLQIKTLNLLQIINLGFLPLAILFWGQKGKFLYILIWIGVSNCIIALSFLWIFFKKGLKKGYEKDFLKYLKILAIFGLPRIFTPVCSAGLTSIIPIIATQYLSITEVGYLSLAVALLIGIGGTVSPLGAILLPHLSVLIGKREMGSIGKGISLLISAISQIFLFIMTQFIIFIDYILILWLGRDFLPASVPMAIIFCALVAYGVFSIGRNILDAVEVKAVNTYNTVISFVMMVILIVVSISCRNFSNLLLSFALTFTIAFNLLGLLSYFSIKKRISLNPREDIRHIKWALLMNGCFAIVSMVIKPYINFQWILWLIFEIILAILYFLFLWALNFQWVRLVPAMIFKRNV